MSSVRRKTCSKRSKGLRAAASYSACNSYSRIRCPLSGA